MTDHRKKIEEDMEAADRNLLEHLLERYNIFDDIGIVQNRLWLERSKSRYAKKRWPSA